MKISLPPSLHNHTVYSPVSPPLHSSASSLTQDERGQPRQPYRSLRHQPVGALGARLHLPIPPSHHPQTRENTRMKTSILNDDTSADRHKKRVLEVVQSETCRATTLDPVFRKSFPDQCRCTPTSPRRSASRRSIAALWHNYLSASTGASQTPTGLI